MQTGEALTFRLTKSSLASPCDVISTFVLFNDVVLTSWLSMIKRPAATTGRFIYMSAILPASAKTIVLYPYQSIAFFNFS
jgi:hypothetical protein